MARLASALDVETHNVLSHSDGKTEYRMTEYFGGPGKLLPGPQSFLARHGVKDRRRPPTFPRCRPVSSLLGGREGRKPSAEASPRALPRCLHDLRADHGSRRRPSVYDDTGRG